MKATKEEWARAEGIINSQTYRFPWAAEDALVHLGVAPCPGSPGTPAWFIDALGAVQLDLNAIYGGDEVEINETIRRISKGGATQIPMLWLGFLAHEFAHSRWSTWKPLPGEKPAVQSVVELFEEIRIESNAADEKGAGGAAYLRHSFKWLLGKLAEGDISTKPRELAHLWALVYGRYLASIANKDEVDAIDSAIRTALDDDTVDILREILDEALSTSKFERLYGLAEEWLELLKSDEDEEEGSGGITITLILHAAKEDDDESESEEGEGEKADGGDDSDDEEGGTPSKGEADSVDARESKEHSDKNPRKDEHEAELKEILVAVLQETADELNPETGVDIRLELDVMKVSSRVFGKLASGMKRSGWTERAPSGALRTEAVRLARMLEAVSLPSITLTHRPSVLPPGRLRGREAVRQSAERSMGLMSTATPWRTTKRDRTRTKPVVVGVMTDTSGSMRWAQAFVADFAWMMSVAGARVGARSAAVTFGDSAEAVTMPGKIPQMVRERYANGGTEKFNDAAAAIEGVLRLSIPSSAAKILFIVSDGELVIQGERERAALWVEKWTQAGTLVVWIGADGHNWKVIRSKERKPGKAINLAAARNPRKILDAMEGEVLRAARGVTL